MAPINQKSCFSTFSTSAKEPFSSCMCRSSLDDGWEWFLPITRRGSFFQDSFFENSRSFFDSAIRDALGRWGETSILTDPWHESSISNLNRYRQLRSHNLKEDNQAVTVSSDSSSHKIVLDVHEFLDGEIKVKVIGEKELLVEGHLEEKKRGAGPSSVQRFSQRFPIAIDADVEAISSVMSSDGVLTITVPRKTSSVSKVSQVKAENQQKSSVSISEKSNTEAASSQERHQSESKIERATQSSASERYCENCYKKLQAEQKTTEQSEHLQGTKFPVNASASTVNCKKSSETRNIQNGFESTVESKSVKETENSVMNTSGSRQEVNASSQSQINTSAATNVKERAGDKEGSRHNIPISVNFQPLPITRRGLFFSDSIFENARNDFESAVQEVLNRWGERSSIMDDLSCYRNLRTRDLREENQAVKVNEDDTNHKFVIDVHDFMDGGEVSVKAVSDREIVVEGQIEKHEGGSKSVKRFYKRFAVPQDIILNSVTSVMSSDGILTITAPKKAPTIQIRDVTSPVRSEKTRESSLQSQQSINKKQSTTHSSEMNCNFEQKSSESTTSNVHQITSSQQENMKKEHIIPVHVENRIEAKANQTLLNAKTATSKETSQENITKENSTSLTSQNSSKAEFSEANHKETGRIITNVNSPQMSNTSSSLHQETQSSNSKHQQTLLSNSLIDNTSSEQWLPITQRGSFFSDSFFESCRQNFQTTVKDILKRFTNNCSQTDDLTAYRDFRRQNISSENQAVSVQEDEQHYKVVVDARDFTEGDINVSVTGERELLIEGQAQKKDGSNSSSKAFSRRFLLPNSVDIQSIASAISSDGILTIESIKNGSKDLSNVKKTSSEAHSRQESHSDSGHNWEEMATKESSEQSDGYSCRSYSKSYRSHQEHSSTNVF